jgi:hypothetical protein
MAYYRRSKNWSHSNAVSNSPAYTPAPADPAEIVRIDAVINNPAFSSLFTNKQDFIRSIKGQAASKKLSDAQVKYLASIEKDLLPVNNSWWNAADPENIRKRQFAVDYYSSNGYYSTLLPRMKADPAYMPEQGIWDKMWANNFINARYKRFIEGNKHNIGDIVIAKFSYGPASNGIVQKFDYNYINGRWQYEVLCFETGSVRLFTDTQVKPAEKKPRKTRSKKV